MNLILQKLFFVADELDESLLVIRDITSSMMILR